MPEIKKKLHALWDEDAAVRKALREAMEESGKKRIVVAAEVSELLGARITPSMLDNFVCGTKLTAIFPARLLRAMAAVTRSRKLRRFFLDEADLRTLEYARLDADLRARARALLQALRARKTA